MTDDQTTGGQMDTYGSRSLTRFTIVPGMALNENLPVWRVVEWRGAECLGGRGSFFKLEDAEAWIGRQA